MKKFICEICGKQHDFYGSIKLLDEPDTLRKMSDWERKERVEKHDYFYLVDQTYFLTKGDLYIKIQGKDLFMHWEAWAKIEASDFYKMTEDLSGATSEVQGKLISAIPQYDDVVGNKIVLIFDLNNKVSYPEVLIKDRSSELGKDFAEGLPLQKVIRWMEQIYHPTINVTS